MAARLPVELLEEYNVSRESWERLETYVELLLTWQKRINLIGPATVDVVWTRHVVDALELLPHLRPPCTSIADLGSGAGVPGLILSVATGVTAHLYESNGKKAAFLREAIRRTRANAVVHQVRLETLAEASDLPRVDYVVSRALAPLALLLGYAEPFLKRGAIGLFHKGRDVDLELTEATKYWRFNAWQHQTSGDSRGVILEVREAVRV